MPTNFSLQRVIYTIKKHLPVRTGWFSAAALSTTGQLGQVIETLAAPIAEAFEDARAFSRTLYLDRATGAGLDRWGTDLDLPRRLGELDTAYRFRLKNEMLRPKLTRKAIEDYLQDLTGLPTRVSEPWRQMDYRGARTRGLAFGAVDRQLGRSGTAHRTSAYYTGGVIDVETDGYSFLTHVGVPEAAAAGVKPYFTSVVTADVLEHGTPAITLRASELGFSVFVRRGETTVIRSGGTRRSGSRTTYWAAEIEANTLAALAFNITEQRPGEFAVYDLWPPVRSWMTKPRSPRSGVMGEPSHAWSDPYVFGPEATGSPPTGEFQSTVLEREAFLRRLFGTRNSDDRMRSGTKPHPFIVDIECEPFDALTQSSRTVLWDQPELVGPYSFYDSALTWESLEDTTWETAIDVGHHGVGGGDLVLSA